MSDFTPGPWKIHDGPTGYIGPIGKAVCEMGKPINIANARLIAAAPDLFATLENLVDNHLIPNKHNDHYEECVETIKKVRGY